MKGTFSSACAVSVGEKRKRSEYGETCNSALPNSSSGSNDNGDTGEGEVNFAVVGPQFNNFDKLRDEVNFVVGQTWALYDTADGMPRLYAQIRKVSAPSFRLRITYLEPDPDDEKEILWFEEGLPVSVGKFRLGQSQNTKDRFKFSHLIHCNEGSNSAHFTVFPRQGETWALYKNWDIKWSSEPDSHSSYEYEFAEVLSDYDDGAGVSVAFLHKAKGFASVFFRMETGDADISQILPHSLYRFSHRIPSFKLTGMEGKVIPKDAYELDQAALPDTIAEKIVPSHLLVEASASNCESDRKIKPQTIYFARKGKVFQTGQIWSFCGDYPEFPLYYGRIQKITFTQVLKQKAVYKLHISRLKATSSPEDVIQYEDKKMPVGCGTFYARKALEIISPDDVSQLIVPQISVDGNEYTILPKIGEVWVIYRFWSQYRELDKVGLCSYDIVEVLDDTLDYKVQLLERQHGPVEYEDIDEDEDEDKKRLLRLLKRKKKFFQEVKEYQYNEIDGSEPIFTITKSERLKFSHKVPASRVKKEVYGEIKDLILVDSVALPDNICSP
ncbi:hypothetical protein CARUB_v10003196mg [Capsella rubella]|uniref:DUF3444 domain-containing protein n=1 Tax=Capsella rubella TaxID=81985 RepID=R0FKT1_9BRAS|nr:uncharacterized protein LOC17882636 [Capsella rubella]EOA22541.1 hypothetical protein CARUB_v10003196mg [Capsella rubella]